MTQLVTEFDRHIKYTPSPNNILGWRDGWIERMVNNCPKEPTARIGYLSFLHGLQAESLPGAYLRDASTADFQNAINIILNRLKD